MSQMPEPVVNNNNNKQNFLPPAERFGPTDNQTFAHHVQTLYELAVPNTSIYHALNSELPVSNLVDTFNAASKEIDLWLEYANIAIFALELDVREGMSIKNVGEMDVLIHKFAPNVDLLRELSQKIISQLKESDEDDENTKKTITENFERIHGDWMEAKAFFQKVKKEMSESKQRRELLDTMDQILASIEELNTNIFEYQEHRHSGMIGGDNVVHSEQENGGRSRPMTPAAQGVSPGNELSSRADVALMRLDSRLDPLSARIEYLKSRLSAPNAPSDPTGALAKKNKILTNKWDALNREMKSLREELKEDRWLTVFKQVSTQANQMMDSLDRAVRQCRDFISRATNRSESPLPIRQLQARGMAIPSPSPSQRFGQQQQSIIQPPVQINSKNFQRLYKNFDSKRKYYLPAVTKMLTILGNDINNEMTKDWEVINKYKSMKERWDYILEGVAEVQRDMPKLEALMDASFIPSNSPPSSKPSSIASSPPISPNMRPVRGVFSPEVGSPPKPNRPISPHHTERALSPPRNNNPAISPSLRSKSPSPRELSPYGNRQQNYLSANSRLSESPPMPSFQEHRPPWNSHNLQQPHNSSPYSPTYHNNGFSNSQYRSVSPQLGYDKYYGRTKPPSRSNSPIRSPSVAATRPISPGERVHASAIPRPVTSMGIAGRANSRIGMRSMLPTSSTPSPGMMSSMYVPKARQARSPTPSSNASDASRPMTPEAYEHDENEEYIIDTLKNMKMKNHPKYVPLKNDPLDAEVAKIVNKHPVSVKIERAPGGKGKYCFGNEGSSSGKKIYLCRLNPNPNSKNKVTVRVGGGWQDFEMFLLEHSLTSNIGARSLFS
ncbi:10577_t:CDS:1 [Ambispora leptoticha]|uniref:10577_t:CDS:1 n=1 Tax=Ambispora leptoticha TaxID=144679 RepID=A0A9N9ARS3_9GLOM|nr:10577_t:CDS:1 [Ambispora leptoticha]